MHAPDPAQVVQAGIIALHLLGRRAHGLGDAVKEFAGRIADANHPEAGMLREGLRDQSRGIGEVDEPGAGRNTLHHLRLGKSHRQRAKGHCGARRSGGLLSGESVFDGKALIPGTRVHAAYPNAAQNKLGPVGCLLEPRGDANLNAGAHLAGNFAADPGDGFRALGVRIEQRQFGHIQNVLCLRQSVDQQRYADAAAANEGDFTHNCSSIPVSRVPHPGSRQCRPGLRLKRRRKSCRPAGRPAEAPRVTRNAGSLR